MRRTGFILPIILGLSVVCGLILTFVVIQQNRKQQVIRNENEIARFREINQRMSQILSAVHLCTCNLRDLVLEDTPFGKQAVLVPSGAYRHHFGFYKLAPDSSCLGADAIDAYDVVLNLSEMNDPTYAKALTVDQIRLEEFVEDLDQVNSSYKRYKGNFKFIASKNQLHSRTNQAQPVGIDIFVEVKNDNTIWRCYPPTKFCPVSIAGKCYQVEEIEEDVDFNCAANCTNCAFSIDLSTLQSFKPGSLIEEVQIVNGTFSGQNCGAPLWDSTYISKYSSQNTQNNFAMVGGCGAGKGQFVRNLDPRENSSGLTSYCWKNSSKYCDFKIFFSSDANRLDIKHLEYWPNPVCMTASVKKLRLKYLRPI